MAILMLLCSEFVSPDDLPATIAVTWHKQQSVKLFYFLHEMYLH